MITDMNSGNNTNRIEVITGVQRRRRWTPEQKLDLVKKTFEPGMTVSMVARMAGVAATVVPMAKGILRGFSGRSRC